MRRSEPVQGLLSSGYAGSLCLAALQDGCTICPLCIANRRRYALTIEQNSNARIDPSIAESPPNNNHGIVRFTRTSPFMLATASCEISQAKWMPTGSHNLLVSAYAAERRIPPSRPATIAPVKLASGFARCSRAESARASHVPSLSSVILKTIPEG
jgi:hypothetical protein